MVKNWPPYFILLTTKLMPVETLGDSGARYLSIIAGKLSQKVNEGTDGAVKREYDVDGNKGVKWELQYKNLSGFITKMEFRQTDYGEMFTVTIEQDWEVDVLSMNTDSRYFADFWRKLKWIDLWETVTLNPYDFEKNGKQIRGLDIRQGWEKITDQYFDWEKKESLHWLPSVTDAERKKYDKDDWKIFFVKIKKFLKAEIEKREIPNIDTWSKKVEKKEEEETISIEDIPF